MIKSKRIFLLILIVSLLLSSANLSYGEIQDMGFEDDLSKWNVNGLITLKTQSVINTDVNVWTILPRYEQMAELVPAGAEGAFGNMADTLSLSAESRNYITGLFPNITNTTYIYRDIELSAGEEFTMGWNYVSTDYEPFNDASLVSLVNIDDPSRQPIINGYYSEVSILGATVAGTGNYSTGSYGSTGWQLAEFKAIYPGTYRLGFAVYNLDDTAYNPYLFLDDWRGTTLKNGVNFEPIPKDTSAPPPPESTSIIFSNYTFDESSENNGSIVTNSQITLYGDTFNGNIGDTITEYGITNLPAGLSAVITKTGEKTAELSFSGSAAQHHETDSIENLIISFSDGAFVGNNASAIMGADSSVFNIVFTDFANAIIYNQPEAKVYGDEPFSLNATSDSNLPLSYTSSNLNVATVDADGIVTIIGSGTTDITVSDGGNDYYAPAADVTRIFTVNKKDASVTPNDKVKAYGEADPALDGVLNGFLAQDSITASYSRTTGESVNTYSISSVMNPSDALKNYNITYNTADFTIDKRQITVQAVTDNKVYDGTATSDVIPTILEGTLANEDNAVLVQEFDDKNVGTNKTLTPSCKVYDQLNTETTTNYDIAYILSASGEITLADPIISLENKTSAYTGNAITIEPAVVIGVPGETPPGNISYTYYTDTACTTLTTPGNSGAAANGQAPVYAGIYYVKATIENTLNYTSQTTSAPGTLTILPASGAGFSIGSELTKTYGDESFMLTASGGSGMGAVSYTSSNPNAASVSSDGYVTINSVGTATITATKASDGNYDVQYASMTITVNKKHVAYAITNNYKTYIGLAQFADVTCDVAGLTAGLDFSIKYYQDDTLVSSAVEPGVYSIVVTTLNCNYEGSAEGTFIISNADQIDFGVGGIPQTVEYSDTFTVYPVENIDGTTTYEIVSGNATVDSATGLVNITGVGEVILKATNTAQNFDVKTAMTSFTVQPKTITVTAIATNRSYEEGNKDVSVELMTGIEGLTAGYTSASMVTADAGVDKVVTVTGITLNNENYKPESTTIYATVNIGMIPVSSELVISGLPSSITYGDDDFRLTAAGQGTGDVIWSSSDRTVAGINSSTGVVTIEGAGSAEITAAKESDGNYSAVSNSITIEVGKKEVTYSIISNTKIYNGSVQYAVVTPSAISLVEDVDYKVTYSQNGNEVDEPIEAGVYDIYIETLNDNYEGYSSGATLTILEADQTYALEITGIPKYIEYEDSFALYANGGNGEGNVTWDVVSGSEYADITSGSGIVYINGVGTVTISATKEGDGNYKNQTEFVTFSTNKKQINIAISNTMKTYNGLEQNVTIKATPTCYSSFENIAEITYFNQSDGEEAVFRNVGTYNVLIDVNDDYTEYYELSGSLSAGASINKADIIITADHKEKVYGEANPKFTLSYNLLGTDVNDLFNEPSITCAADEASNVGEYDILLSYDGDGNNSNYNVILVNGKLSITPAELTVTAEDNSVYYGKNPPACTYNIYGFKGNDSINDLEGTVVFYCDYAKGSAEGEYDINISGLSSNNYNIKFVRGKLTVLPPLSSGGSGDGFVQRNTISVKDVSSTLLNNPELITVTADMENAFNESVDLRITDDEEASDKIFKFVGEGFDVYPFDISLYSRGTNNKVQPNSGYKVIITLPLPEALLDCKDDVQVVYTDNESLITLKSELVQNEGIWCIVFEAEHFSPYALIVDKEWKNSFSDVDETDWFYDAVRYVNIEGLMSGTGLFAFEPNLETTRSMIVTILYRMEKQPEVIKTSSFDDVSTDAWYYDSVSWGEENGIVKGYDSETFGPDDKITREQLAAILYRYATYKGYIMKEPADLSKYNDTAKISSWAVESIGWAVSEDLISGTTLTTLEPAGLATRAQTATCLMRFMQNIN